MKIGPFDLNDADMAKLVYEYETMHRINESIDGTLLMSLVQRTLKDVPFDVDKKFATNMIIDKIMFEVYRTYAIAYIQSVVKTEVEPFIREESPSKLLN